MKKFLLGLGLSLSVVAFTACDGGGGEYTQPDDGYYQQDYQSQQNISAIDITDIYSGYQINGVIESGEKAGQKAILIYCPDKKYAYYRGNDEQFYGTYKLNDSQTEVVMKDDTDGGAYAIQTPNSTFKVGEFYSCRGLDRYTTGLRVTHIVENPCSGHQ